MKFYIELYTNKGCMPCTVVKSILEKDEIPFREFDLETDAEKVSSNKVMSVPTIIAFAETGEEVERAVGIDAGFLDRIVGNKGKLLEE